MNRLKQICEIIDHMIENATERKMMKCYVFRHVLNQSALEVSHYFWTSKDDVYDKEKKASILFNLKDPFDPNVKETSKYRIALQACIQTQKMYAMKQHSRHVTNVNERLNRRIKLELAR